MRHVWLKNEPLGKSQLSCTHRRIEGSLPARDDTSGVLPLCGTLQLLPFLPLDSVWVLPVRQTRRKIFEDSRHQLRSVPRAHRKSGHRHAELHDSQMSNCIARGLSDTPIQSESKPDGHNIRTSLMPRVSPCRRHSARSHHHHPQMKIPDKHAQANREKRKRCVARTVSNNVTNEAELSRSRWSTFCTIVSGRINARSESNRSTVVTPDGHNPSPPVVPGRAWLGKALLDQLEPCVAPGHRPGLRLPRCCRRRRFSARLRTPQSPTHG